MSEIPFEAKSQRGNMFRVYSNRLEYEVPRKDAGINVHGKMILPLRSISRIEVPAKSPE